MPRSRNRLVVARVYEEILNEGNIELTREVVSHHAIDHAPQRRSSLPISTDEGMAEFLDELCAAFPDATWTVEHVRVKGDKTIVRTTFSGSHHGDFRGLRATGRHCVIQGVDAFRIEDGKIVEHWGELDMSALRNQLKVRRSASGTGRGQKA
jgi:steroid delta-isomerase-like uncharacterized protein